MSKPENYIYRIYCTKCLRETYIDEDNQHEWIKEDKSLFDSVGLEYELLECSKCGEPYPNIFGKDNKCVFNKDEIRYCNRCHSVIPLKRLLAMPQTNMCSVKCIKDQKQEYEEMKKPKTWPSVPQGHEECKRCGSKTEVAWSETNKEYYIRCSTIPKCRRMVPMPKFVDTKSGQMEYDVLGGFEDLMQAALTARKNKDIKALESINKEFYRRIEKRKMNNKRPMKTAVKGHEQTNAWIKELKNR